MTLDELLYELKALISFARYIRDTQPDLYEKAIDFSKPKPMQDELFS